jgi:hypothetical protein
MFRFKPTAPFLFCFAVLFSCERIEADKNQDPQGYADSQMVGNWKITEIFSDKPYDWDGNGSAETDIYSVWSDCEKDNLYIFDGTKTGIYKITCSLTKNGTWHMPDRITIVFIPDGLEPRQENITGLTSNEFKTKTIVISPNGQNFVIGKTWTRQ